MLAACGWADAALLRQQDVSEAFTFITEKLELPLLTLKMDIFHTGKEDAGDDHKFVNERLLEVAIPPQIGDTPVTLEDCLEAYFNNRVEIRRFLERQNTLRSVGSFDSLAKGHATHVETVELAAPTSSPSPMSSAYLTPFPELTEEPSELPDTPTATIRPQLSPRVHRTSSIVRERFFPDADDGSADSDLTSSRPQNRHRKGSVRKEVLMPAWQIFSLIRKYSFLLILCHSHALAAWYTDSIPANDAETAAHFSTKRPILGMCLKRYAVRPDGETVRLDTYVDIPTEIGLPHFIKDDNLEDDAPLYGNFKLSLQAVVCHRGSSVDSGHYISLVRGSSLAAFDSVSCSDFSLRNDMFLDHNNYWLRFDDIAEERITLTDIEKALKEESPYLLFYQILPTEADPADLTPPPYEESDRHGDIFFEKSRGEHLDSPSETDLQDPSRRTSVSEGGNRSLQEIADRIDANWVSDNHQEVSKSRQKGNRSRSRPASSEKKLSAAFSYLARRKSTEPLSATQSTERSSSSEQRRSEDALRDFEKAVRTSTFKKATRPDRECTVM